MNNIALDNKQNLNISVSDNNSLFNNILKKKAIYGIMAVTIISGNTYSVDTWDIHSNKKIEITDTNIINKTYSNAYNGLKSRNDLNENSLEVKYMKIDNLRDNSKKINERGKLCIPVDFRIEEDNDFVSSISPIKKTDIKLKINNRGKLPIKYNWEV